MGDRQLCGQAICAMHDRAQWPLTRPQIGGCRDQRAALLRSTGRRSPPSPSRPHPFRFAIRALVTSDNLAWAARAAAFGLRLCSGAVALRLRFAMRASPPSAPLLRTPTTDRKLDTATRELVHIEVFDGERQVPKQTTQRAFVSMPI